MCSRTVIRKHSTENCRNDFSLIQGLRRFDAGDAFIELIERCNVEMSIFDRGLPPKGQWS